MIRIIIGAVVFTGANAALLVRTMRVVGRRPAVRIPYLRPSKQLPQAPVLNEVHDGLTPRYTGTDHDAAETVWTQLERHGVSGQHRWYKDRRLHQQRGIAD